MSTEEKSKKEFEWPEELVVLLRHEQTRLPFLRVVFYVPQAKVYIDEERNLYHHSTYEHEGSRGIQLKLYRDKDSDVEVGYSVVKDDIGDAMGGIAAMFGAVCSDDRERVYLYEHPRGFVGKTRTVFRTAMEAHFEWYQILKREQAITVVGLQKLEEWAEEHDVALEPPNDDT